MQVQTMKEMPPNLQGGALSVPNIHFLYNSRLMMDDYLSNTQKFYNIKAGKGADKRISSHLAYVNPVCAERTVHAS